MTSTSQQSLAAFVTARDFLLDHLQDYDTAYADFRCPELDEFNWALDWFDSLAVASASAQRPALWIVEQDGSETSWTFSELSRRSNQVANWLYERGVRRGDRMILMLGNQVELWETILATMKLGAVIIPASTLLAPADLADRVRRGNVRHVVARGEDTEKFTDVPGDYTRIVVRGQADGWLDYASSAGADTSFVPDGVTRADDTLLLY